MGKVRYKEASIKFDKIAPLNKGNITNQNLARGNNIAEVLKINVDKINSFEKQARKFFDQKELNNLANSIKEVGIISPLILIKDREQGKFQVINGERRLKAAKEIGLNKVPCIIIDKEEKSELIAIIDNVQRVDLHPIELANAYQSFIKSYGDKKHISEKIGVSYSSFIETLKLNEFPAEIKIFLLNNNIRSRAVFRKLLKLPNVEKMKENLGIINSNAKISKEKKILEIFMKNEHIESRVNTIDLPLSKRRILLQKLHEIISQIENQKR